MCQVEMQGRNGDIALLDCLKVGIGGGGVGNAAQAIPEIGIAARIRPFDQL